MSLEENSTTSQAPSMQYALRHSAKTDVGMRRDENQDAHGYIQGKQFKLYLVADGMGGVGGGATASTIAVNTLSADLANLENVNQQEILKAVEHANEEILARSRQDQALEGMGTTLVGLTFVPQGLIVTNIGDSRAYRIRDETVARLTVDHTLVTELLRSGAVSLDQVQGHAISHMLTRSLGAAPKSEADCFLYRDIPRIKDKYLLCSDGLYNFISDGELGDIVASNPPHVAAENLIELANQRGGSDNITVIVIELVPPHKSTQEINLKNLSGDKIERISSKYARVINSYTANTLFNKKRSAQQNLTILLSAIILLAGLGFLGGMFVSQFFGKKKLNVAFEESEPKAELLEKLSESNLANLLEENNLLNPELSPELAAQRRKVFLRDHLTKLVQKLSLLNAENSDEIGSQTELAALKLKHQTDLEKTPLEIENEKRRLSVWLVRQKQLVTTDAINLAAEVSVSSANVKAMKEAFELVSWEYLKEYENLKLKAEDKGLERKVVDLVKSRNEAKNNLAHAVKNTIAEEILKSRKALTELTQKEQDLRQAIIDVQSSLDFIELLNSADEDKKAQEKEALLKEKSVTEAELAGLESL